MSSILLLKRLIDEEHLNRMNRIDMRRLHVISARELRRLSVSGKFKAEWQFLQHLHDTGYRMAERRPDNSFQRLASHSMLDPASIFLDQPHVEPPTTIDLDVTKPCTGRR
jgi:hypothetical protein